MESHSKFHGSKPPTSLVWQKPNESARNDTPGASSMMPGSDWRWFGFARMAGDQGYGASPHKRYPSWTKKPGSGSGLRENIETKSWFLQQNLCYMFPVTFGTGGQILNGVYIDWLWVKID